MLAGQDVFPGRTALEILFAHVQKEPEPLAALVAGEVPAALSDLIMRCLAKDPQARPESADAVLTALKATGLSARWTMAEAGAWWERQQEAPPSG
jgi:serine/threonine-protein kinase